ncbi:hypothetical protein ABIA22_001782 [Sinorhizobium fredii]
MERPRVLSSGRDLCDSGDHLTPTGCVEGDGGRAGYEGYAGTVPPNLEVRREVFIGVIIQKGRSSSSLLSLPKPWDLASEVAKGSSSRT